MKVVIAGKGAWGTTLASLIAENKHKVSFWSKKQPLASTKVFILSVPTQAMRSVLQDVGKVKNGIMVVNCAKGIERKTHKLPFEIVREILGSVEYFTLIGPSFAREVQNKMPTLVSLGSFSEDQKIIKRAVSIFQTDNFRVKPTPAVEILELAGALKNVYAIACGIAEGLGFAMNTRAKLMSIALDEVYRLSKSLHFKIDNSAIPGIIGDLILTCNSGESRNFTLGKLLVAYPVSECLKRINGTVEGFYTASSVPYFLQKTKVDLPLAKFVLKIIQKDKPQGVGNLFAEFVRRV